MIVTIDGPAGAGKSTAARMLAGLLGFEFLDTGAMYRAVALAAGRAGIALDDDRGLERLLLEMRLVLEGGGVFLEGEDVSLLIRSPEISAQSSKVAANAVVRRGLAAMQRKVAAGRNMVCEGRDQGTFVFPDAACKFFLLANPEERLRRRARELEARGCSFDLEELRQTQEERDRRDAERDLAPMKPAEDAILLDSTHLTLEQVVAGMESEVRLRLSQKPR